jgi:hypothetical protein
MKELQSAIKQFTKKVDNLEKSELRACLCKNPDNTVVLSEIIRYVPEDVARVTPPECKSNQVKIATIHSHRDPENKISFFDTPSATIRESDIFCITAGYTHETRCYKLNRFSSFPKNLPEYYIKHKGNLSDTMNDFLADAVKDWILDEQIFPEVKS